MQAGSVGRTGGKKENLGAQYKMRETDERRGQFGWQHATVKVLNNTCYETSESILIMRIVRIQKNTAQDVLLWS